MNHGDVIEGLQKDAAAREKALTTLRRIREELGQAIDELSGKNGRKKPRITGRGVTKEEVRRAVEQIRKEQPSLSRDELLVHLKKLLRTDGRTLTGLSLRLDEVLRASQQDLN